MINDDISWVLFLEFELHLELILGLEFICMDALGGASASHGIRCIYLRDRWIFL
jgi:hypothetical protein